MPIHIPDNTCTKFFLVGKGVSVKVLVFEDQPEQLGRGAVAFKDPGSRLHQVPEVTVFDGQNQDG